jgi:hypothetical protein
MQEALLQQRLAISQPMQPRDHLERKINVLSRQANSSTAVKHLRGWGGSGEVDDNCSTAVKEAQPSGFIPCTRALMVCAARQRNRE